MSDPAISDPATSDYDYDLFVIGAGSGGVRASRVAAGYGARVAVAEEFHRRDLRDRDACPRSVVYGSHSPRKQTRDMADRQRHELRLGALATTGSRTRPSTKLHSTPNPRSRGFSSARSSRANSVKMRAGAKSPQDDHDRTGACVSRVEGNEHCIT